MNDDTKDVIDARNRINASTLWFAARISFSGECINRPVAGVTGQSVLSANSETNRAKWFPQLLTVWLARSDAWFWCQLSSVGGNRATRKSPRCIRYGEHPAASTGHYPRSVDGIPVRSRRCSPTRPCTKCAGWERADDRPSRTPGTHTLPRSPITQRHCAVVKWNRFSISVASMSPTSVALMSES